MSKYDQDEIPTSPSGHRRMARSLGDLEELVGQLMADQIAIRKDLSDIAHECRANRADLKSKRPASIIDNGRLTIIITATTIIVTSIVTALRALGVLK